MPNTNPNTNQNAEKAMLEHELNEARAKLVEIENLRSALVEDVKKHVENNPDYVPDDELRKILGENIPPAPITEQVFESTNTINTDTPENTQSTLTPLSQDTLDKINGWDLGNTDNTTQTNEQTDTTPEAEVGNQSAATALVSSIGKIIDDETTKKGVGQVAAATGNVVNTNSNTFTPAAQPRRKKGGLGYQVRKWGAITGLAAASLFGLKKWYDHPSKKEKARQKIEATGRQKIIFGDTLVNEGALIKKYVEKRKADSIENVNAAIWMAEHNKKTETTDTVQKSEDYQEPPNGENGGHAAKKKGASKETKLQKITETKGGGKEKHTSKETKKEVAHAEKKNIVPQAEKKAAKVYFYFVNSPSRKPLDSRLSPRERQDHK